VNDEELFTRLFYFGTIQMDMGEKRFRLLPIGAFLDLWACHKAVAGVGTGQARRRG
jgi:hypothetical protein